MIENNTFRFIMLIGAVIITATIIVLLVKEFPQLKQVVTIISNNRINKY